MYNYKNFKAREYDFSIFNGPRAGERALDFHATTPDGEKVTLSDFFGSWLVLEMGSITCPITESKVMPMNKLAQTFSDVIFLVLYVREAHPGEKIRQHDSLEEKISCAQRFRDEYGVARKILIDDIEGTAHQAYGSMPNSVYIINPSGTVVFRGDWNTIDTVQEILEERDPDKIYKKERFSGRPYFGNGNPFRAFAIAGSGAIWDFMKALPQMIIKHIRKPSS